MPSCCLVLTTSDMVTRRLVDIPKLLTTVMWYSRDKVAVVSKLCILCYLCSNAKQESLHYINLSASSVGACRLCLRELVHRCSCWCSFKTLSLHIWSVWNGIRAARQKIMLKLGCNVLRFRHSTVAFQSIKCFSEIYPHRMHYLLKCRM